MSDYGDSFRLAPFQEFYAEIIRLKQLAVAGVWVSPSAGANPTAAQPDDVQTQTGTWIYYPDVVSDAGADDVARITKTITPKQDSSTALVKVEPEGNGSAMEFSELLQPTDSFRVSTVIWHRLVTLFQRQAIRAWNDGGSYGAEAYRDAQYVMVALADDIFLHLPWEGQRAWDSNLLEAKIFRSHAAGQEFFEKLDHLLREQNPMKRDLAAVYLMALSLGFKGKYYDVNDRGKLAKLAGYRRQLFIFIYGREPDLDDETRYVFPEAYFHKVREEGQRKLSDPRKWIVVLCLVIIVYVAATQAFWIQFTRGLNAVNQSITKIIGELKAQP
jgi:type VI secretion system protein ImpK